MGRTTIQVSDELADELHDRKGRGESYEDVIWELIHRGDADDVEDDQEPSETWPPEEQEPEPPRPTDGAESGVEAFLSEVEFPSSKPHEECVEAVRAAYEYLQVNGKGTMREFVQEVMPEHPVGYDVPELEPGERYRGAWWRRVVKPGLEAQPDVEKPGAGGSEWTYTGE